MEIHVYLNGELKERTFQPRRQVITRMQRDIGALLLRECFINRPTAYLKMRFVGVPVEVSSSHITGTEVRIDGAQSLLQG